MKAVEGEGLSDFGLLRSFASVNVITAAFCAAAATSKRKHISPMPWCKSCACRLLAVTCAHMIIHRDWQETASASYVMCWLIVVLPHHGRLSWRSWGILRAARRKRWHRIRQQSDLAFDTIRRADLRPTYTVRGFSSPCNNKSASRGRGAARFKDWIPVELNA